jgi:hypothetical protein
MFFALFFFLLATNNVLGKTMDDETFNELYAPFKSNYHDSHKSRYFKTLSLLEPYLKPHMYVLAGGGGDMVQM